MRYLLVNLKVSYLLEQQIIYAKSPCNYIYDVQKYSHLTKSYPSGRSHLILPNIATNNNNDEHAAMVF